jgi:hypothetical protein
MFKSFVPTKKHITQDIFSCNMSTSTYFFFITVPVLHQIKMDYLDTARGMDVTDDKRYFFFFGK